MIAYVFDGKSEVLQQKGVYVVAGNPELERSSTQERYSEIVLLGPGVENTVKHLDLIKIELGNFRVAWGFAISPHYSKEEPDCLEISFGFGSDGYLSDIYLDVSTIKNNIIDYLGDELVNVGLPVWIERGITGDRSGYVVTPNHELSAHQCFRQLYRQGFIEYPWVFEYELHGSLQRRLYMRYVKRERKYTINLEDALDYEVEFSRDKYNCLRSFYTDDKDVIHRGITVYLTADGGITDNVYYATKPIIRRDEHFSQNDYSREAVENKLRDQEYQNYIQITFDLNTYIYNFMVEKDIFTTIGANVDIWLDSETKESSIIDEISLYNDIVTLTLGQGSRRIFDKLKKKEVF